MKFFAFIISFYFLCLPCVPCSDVEECMVKADAKISITDNHQEHSHEKEACSPFCACACCSSITIFQPVTKLVFAKLYIKKVYNLYISSSIKGISLPIWQPPQLVA